MTAGPICVCQYHTIKDSVKHQESSSNGLRVLDLPLLPRREPSTSLGSSRIFATAAQDKIQTWDAQGTTLGELKLPPPLSFSNIVQANSDSFLSSAVISGSRERVYLSWDRAVPAQGSLLYARISFDFPYCSC